MRKSLAVVGAAALVLAGAQGVSHAASATTQVGDYFSIAPSRILDTREGNGAAQHTVGADQILPLQVAGRGGVPSTGVSAVVLNVTVTNPSSSSFLTVYPAGIDKPDASNLNILKGWTGANSVTVKLGTDGAVDIYNQAGNLDVIADVTGYYADVDGAFTPGTGGEYQPFIPFREVDTRTGDTAAKLVNGEALQLPFKVDGDETLYQHIRAVAVNVTAVDADSPGFFTGWSGDGPAPNASLLNFTKGTVVPNFAIIPTKAAAGNASSFAIGYTGGGTVDLIVDVLGFFDDNTLGGGLHFTPSDPKRIIDTRSGVGLPSALGSGQTAEMVLAGGGRDTTQAISANVTGVSPTASTFVQLWPSDETQPAAGSTLNLNPGDVKPNATIVTFGADGGFDLYNLRGTTNLVMDLNGTYTTLPTATAAAKSKLGKLGAVAGTPRVVR